MESTGHARTIGVAKEWPVMMLITTNFRSFNGCLLEVENIFDDLRVLASIGNASRLSLNGIAGVYGLCSCFLVVMSSYSQVGNAGVLVSVFTALIRFFIRLTTQALQPLRALKIIYLLVLTTTFAK